MALIPYARVSSGKQLSGLSMKHQNDQEYLQGLAIEHHTTLSPLVYADHGVSSFKGKNAKTGELSRLLKDIEANVIRSGDIVVMRALDRLSRQNLTSGEMLYNQIISRGVRILTTIDNFVYKADDPMSAIMKTLALNTANEESAKKSYLTNKNASFRIDQFKRNERPEGGHSWDVGVGRHPFWIALDKKKVIQHPVNWNFARQMVDMTLDGVGVTHIQRFAHSVGLELSYTGCAKMFNSKAIYGTLVITHQDETHVLEGYYPALATKEEFYKIRAIKDAQTKTSNAGRNKVSLLAGINKFYCGDCGSFMCIGRNVKQQIEYYRCGCRMKKCFPYLKQELLDRLVLRSIASRNWDDDNSSTVDTKAIELELQAKTEEYQSEQRFVIQNRDLFDDSMIQSLKDKKSELDQLANKLEDLKLSTAKNEVFDFVDKDVITLYQEHCDKVEGYINGDIDLKTEARVVISKLVERITVDHRHLLKIEYQDGYVDYYVLLRRRDERKIHQRFFIKLIVVSEEQYQVIIETQPELTPNFTTVDRLDGYSVYFEDCHSYTPVTPIKILTPEQDFFDLLVDDVYEWKRASIMNAGATATQWQKNKDADVSLYGWNKSNVEITTRHYTKKVVTCIYKGDVDIGKVCALFDARSATII